MTNTGNPATLSFQEFKGKFPYNTNFIQYFQIINTYLTGYGWKQNSSSQQKFQIQPW